MGFPEAPHFLLPPVARGGDPRPLNRFYKQIGNAVCPPVVRALGALVLQRLQEAAAEVELRQQQQAKGGEGTGAV